MHKNPLFLSLLGAVLLASMALQPARAAEPVPDDALAAEINALDGRFFAAFNACDVDTMEHYLVEDFEFYHDKGGFTDGRAPMLAMERERCSRTDTVLRREVVADSLQVFPLHGYGAVQQGVHRFYLREGGGPERLIEIARFTHVWHETPDGWKIARAISYDHQEL